MFLKLFLFQKFPGGPVVTWVQFPGGEQRTHKSSGVSKKKNSFFKVRDTRALKITYMVHIIFLSGSSDIDSDPH